jgi:anion-transporting  ArsA/GET3 family ATPase
MADKSKVEGETPKIPAEPEQTQPVETPKTESEEVFDKDRAMETIKKLREEVKAKTKAEKRLSELEAEEAKRKEAAMSEQEKLAKRNAELETQLREAQLTQQRATAADEANLPKELADRIKGETPEDMEADAQAIAAVIKAQAKAALTSGSNTNPAGATKTGTDEQWRLFLAGRGKLPGS